MLSHFIARIQSIAGDTERYLNTLIRADPSIQPFMRSHPGYKKIKFFELAITPDGIPALRDFISEWMQSEEGTWVMDNVSNIKVDGCYDAAVDLGRFVISSRLSEQEAVEYSLRWL